MYSLIMEINATTTHVHQFKLISTIHEYQGFNEAGEYVDQVFKYIWANSWWMIIKYTSKTFPQIKQN